MALITAFSRAMSPDDRRWFDIRRWTASVGVSSAMALLSPERRCAFHMPPYAGETAFEVRSMAKLLASFAWIFNCRRADQALFCHKSD